MVVKPDSRQFRPKDLQKLQSEVALRTRLQEISHKIFSAKDLDDLFVHLEADITALFDAERLTVYGIDGIQRQLVSRFKSGDEIKEIRLPISTSSIAGHAAFKQKLLNIKNVRDPGELRAVDQKLVFDESWDQKTGYKTRQVLAHPIRFKNYLLGVVQVINHRNGKQFSKDDETAIAELARMFGNGLYAQKRINRTRLGKFDYLVESGLLTVKKLQDARKQANRSRVPLETLLISKCKIHKTDIGKALSHYYAVPFVSRQTRFNLPAAILKGLKPDFMRRNVWAPWSMENGRLHIAIDNPEDLVRIDEIKRLFPGRKLKIHVALKSDILQLIDQLVRYLNAPGGIDDIIERMADSVPIKKAPPVQFDEAASLNEKDSAVIQLVNKIIIDALERKASDIHIEPHSGDRDTRIRFRVDGNCQLYRTIPERYKNAVVSRVKIMSDLDISERRRPQDGKIRFRMLRDKSVELRVATIPTQGAIEDVVMRIVSAGEPMPLEALHFSKRNYDEFLNAIKMPHGVIFVCGPTGSGKTTTLHAALQHINKVDKKIWTAEDPVEITQTGLRQVQVRPKIKFGFSEALRAFLRADPDVIMVGEMRDRETTRIGIEASLTGHLVLSTLHTNSAPESVSRLLDMGMDPFNFADAVICILAQRLVLTLCQSCKSSYRPRSDELGELIREYGHEAYAQHRSELHSSRPNLYRPVGCRRCNQTGYRGRMGIHELLVGSDPIKKMIQGKARVDEIRHQGVLDGMTTLKQDGIAKIFAGYCDLIQVRKICIK